MVFAVITCGLTLGSASAADYNYTGPANSSSSGYQVDNQHTGQSSYNGPQTNTTKWISNCSGGNSVKIAVGSDGTIYTGGVGVILRAFTPNGAEKWNYTPPHQNILGIAVGNNETIYLTLSNGLCALYNNGTQKWFYDATTQDSYSLSAGSYPVIGSDGTIYVATYSSTKMGLLYAFDPDGTVKWGLNTPNDGGGGIRSSPAIGHDGTIYVCTGSSTSTYIGTLYALDPAAYALDPTGATPKWTYTLPSGNVNGNSPAIGADGTIYLITRNGFVYAINPNGTLKWSYNTTTSSGNGGIAVASDGTIYAAFGSTLYALDPAEFASNPDTATPKWTYILGTVSMAPTFGADGTIYIGDNSKMYAIDPDGNLKWSYYTGGTAQHTAVISADRTLYFSCYVSTGPKLFAIQDLVGDFTVDTSNGLGVQFTDTSSNIPTSWSWDFGDGTYSSEQNPVHTYGQAGTYHVTLTVGLASGETSTVQKDVTVNQAPTLDPIGDKIVDENKSVSFTVVGHDSVGDNLTYSVTGLPLGATFNTSTGAFSWIPTFSQAGTYHITFTVSDGSLTDSETITITVNDVDNVAPTVTKIDPVKNAVVKADKVIKVTFNESVKAGSLWVDLKNSSGTLIPCNYLVSGNVLTITPKSLLGNGKYSLCLHTGAVTDLIGNKLSVYSSSFIVDAIVPTVSKIDPANGATKVAASKTIKITFNEAIKAGKFWVDLKNSSGKVVPFKYSISGSVLTIDPTSNLVESLYSLVIHTGAVTDLIGNPVALKSTKFSVGTSPTVTTVDPKNGATKVARNKVIKVTFNENIKASSSFWIELKTSNGKSVKITKSISGKVLSITHAKLAANTKYKLIIHTGAVTDKASNPVAAKTYTFTTGST